MVFAFSELNAKNDVTAYCTSQSFGAEGEDNTNLKEPPPKDMSPQLNTPPSAASLRCLSFLNVFTTSRFAVHGERNLRKKFS